MSADPRDLRRRLFAIAAEQAGYFSASQAKQVGYSYPAQAHHVRASNWLRVDRGIFRLSEWVPGEHDELARWTLWSKGRAVVSHETALAVHGVGEFESPRIHLTVPPGFRMRAEPLVLRHAELDTADMSAGQGFWLTTVTRSLIDVAAGAVDDDQIERAIDEALERGMTTRRQLRSRAEAIDVKAALRIERAIGQLASS